MKKIHLPLLLASFLAIGALQGVAISHAYAEEKAEAKGDKKDDKKAVEGTTGGRFAGDPIYIHLDPMVMPVINEKGVEQLVTILLDVQVKDFATADAIHSNMPRVKDSLMRNLYGGLGQGSLRNGKMVNVNKVKAKALSAVGEVVGKENIIDVLVQGVAQRML